MFSDYLLRNHIDYTTDGLGPVRRRRRVWPSMALIALALLPIAAGVLANV